MKIIFIQVSLSIRNALLRQALLCTFYLWCFLDTMTELRRWNRCHMAKLKYLLSGSLQKFANLRSKNMVVFFFFLNTYAESYTLETVTL